MSAVLEPAGCRTTPCRAMTVQDLDAVTAVEVAAYGFPWSRGNFADSLRAGYLAEVLQGDDGSVLGYFVAMPGVQEMHLLNLTVAPPAQGRGHGRALMDRLEQTARELGHETLWLEVRTGNARARALYARRGYVEQGLRRGYYPAAGSRREDAVLMTLALKPPGRHAAQ